MVRRSALLGLFGASLSLFVPPSGWTEEVFVTAPNNEIVAIDFETGRSRTAVRDNGTNFQGLAAWGAGNGLRLVAANATQGGDLRVYDPATGAGARIASLREAHGVAVNLYGDVFAVNRSVSKDDVVLFVPRQNGCSTSVSGPFSSGCGPGGYASAVYVDDSVVVHGSKTKELADVRFLSSAVSGLGRPGQLLVLVKDPAMLIVYTEPAGGWKSCDGHCEPEEVASLPGYGPTGLDVTGDAVLVTTEQGVVLEVSSAGSVPLVNLGGKGAKIAVGALNGQQVAYATVSNKGGKLFRFFTDGSDLRSVRTQVPEGVTSETSRVVALNAGEEVGVLLPTMRTTFDRILSKGLIDTNCGLYPRPGGPGPFTLRDLGFAEDGDVVIPAYIDPFRLGDPVTGPQAYFICRVDTSAKFRKTVEIHEDEERVLGYQPDCDTDNSAEGVKKQARFFWAPSTNEPENAEGLQFIDISAGCGSNVGRGMKFSWTIPAAQDTRSICRILNDKLDGLEGTLELFGNDIEGACIGDAGDPGPAAEAFDAIGEDPEDWVFVPSGQGVFGDANGFLVGGGTATFAYKDAAWSHRFGVTDASGDTTLVANSASPGPPVEFNVSGSFTFFFENNPDFPAGRAQSDGSNGSARMAVYRNLYDPGLFALFYDDGGGSGPSGTDADYNDFIVTVKGEAGTLCALETTVADGQEALGDVDACEMEPTGSDLDGVLAAFQELTEIVEAHVEDINDTDQNRSGEIEARARSGEFMTCKLTDCPDTGSGHP